MLGSPEGRPPLRRRASSSPGRSRARSCSAPGTEEHLEAADVEMHAARPPALARLLGQRALPRRAGGDDGLRRPLPPRRARLLDRRGGSRLRRRAGARGGAADRASAAGRTCSARAFARLRLDRHRDRRRARGRRGALGRAGLAARPGARRRDRRSRWRGTASRSRSRPSSAAAAAARRSASSRRCSPALGVAAPVAFAAAVSATSWSAGVRARRRLPARRRLAPAASL